MVGRSLQKNKLINDKFRMGIMGLVFIFPIIHNIVRHAGSAILLIFACGGIYLGVRGRTLKAWFDQEKDLILTFGGYFLISVLAFGIQTLRLESHHRVTTRYLEQEALILLFIPVYFCLREVRVHKRVLWMGLLIGGALLGGYALLNSHLTIPDYRVRGAYSEISFGDISMIMGFMGLAGIPFWFRQKPFYVIFPILSFIAALAASFLSGTRGAWIAIPFLGAILACQLTRVFKPYVVRILIIGILSFPVLAYYIPCTGLGNRIHLMVTETREYLQGRVGESVGGRFEMWAVAIDIIKEHPFTGVGPGGYRRVVREMVVNGKRDPIIKDRTQPHNVYLHAMVDAGILGGMGLLLVFGVPLRRILRAIKGDSPHTDVAFVGAMLIAGYMLFGLTESVFYRNINVTFYTVMLAVTLAILSRTERDQ